MDCAREEERPVESENSVPSIPL